MFENNTNEDNFSGVTPENNNTLEAQVNDAPESNMSSEQSTSNIGLATAVENGMKGTPIDFDGITPTNNSSEIGFSNNKSTRDNKSSWLLAIVGSLLVVFIGFFVFYINTMGNPKNVFTNIINTMFNSAENILSTQFNFEESALIDGTVKIESNIEEVKALNNEIYGYTFGYDIKNKKAELSAGVKVDNKDRLKAAVNIKENNMYIYLNELFDKVIKVDEDMVKDSTGMTINEIFEKVNEVVEEEKTDDMLYVVKEMKKITNKGFKNAEYEKTTDIVDINGKEIKATKMSLEFNSKNGLLIFGTMIDEMLKNDKLLTKLAELSHGMDLYYVSVDSSEDTHITKEEIKKELIKSLKELKKDLELEDEEDNPELCGINGCDEIDYPVVSIYTGGLFNTIIKVSTEEYGEEVFSYITYKDTKIIESGEMRIVIEKDNLSIYEDGEKVVEGKVNSFETDNIDVTFKSLVEESPAEGSVTYINSKDNVKFNFKINTDISIGFFETTKYALKLDISFENKKVNDKEYNNKIIVEVDVDGQNVKVSNDATLYLGKDIATNKTDNTIKVSELTETDLTNIINKLDQYEDVFVISAIKNMITSYSNQYTDNCSPGVNCIDDTYYSDDYYYSDFNY